MTNHTPFDSGDDAIEVSAELDQRGDAEYQNPGDPLVDDEESLDADLFSGNDSAFGVQEDIDTLSVVSSESSVDDLDDADYAAESAEELDVNEV